MDELDESEAVSRAARGRLSGLRISFLQPPVALQTRWNTKLRPNSYLRFSIFLPPRTGAAHATALGRAKALQAGSGNARGEWAAGAPRASPRVFCSFLQPYKQFGTTCACLWRCFPRFGISASAEAGYSARHCGSAGSRRCKAGARWRWADMAAPRTSPRVFCSFVQLYEWFGVACACFHWRFLRFGISAHRRLPPARRLAR